MKDTTHHVEVDGLKLRVRALGDGPQTIMLLHGWMATSAVWDDLIAHLDLAGRRLLVPDLRGSGGSSAPASLDGYGLVRFTADNIAILDALGVGRATIVGNSMGGQLALCLAAARPTLINGVIGLCPVPTTGIPLPDDARGLFSSSGGDRGKQSTILGLAAPQMTDAVKTRLLDVAGTIDPAAIATVFAAWSAGADTDLATVEAPVLVVGTDDPFLPAAFLNEAVVQKIARGRFAYLPGAGHYPQVERPLETAALINAFLAGA